MDYKNFTEANREAWNEVIPIHKPHRQEKDLKYFLDPEYQCLNANETKYLSTLDLKGKRVAHISCNNGRELISVLRMGAESGVGFDISDEVIEEANQLQQLTGANAEFVRTDVYDINHDYDDQFDLVLVTIGCFSWLPDLKSLFGIVSRLLKAGGYFFISEEHPFINMLSYEREQTDTHYKIVEPYFSKQEAICFNDGIDYYGLTTYEGKTTYEFIHTVSDIINAVVHNGMTIQQFHEFTEDISNLQKHHEKEGMVPLSYILIAKKI